MEYEEVYQEIWKRDFFELPVKGMLVSFYPNKNQKTIFYKTLIHSDFTLKDSVVRTLKNYQSWNKNHLESKLIKEGEAIFFQQNLPISEAEEFYFSLKKYIQKARKWAVIFKYLSEKDSPVVQ